MVYYKWINTNYLTYSYLFCTFTIHYFNSKFIIHHSKFEFCPSFPAFQKKPAGLPNNVRRLEKHAGDLIGGWNFIASSGAVHSSMQMSSSLRGTQQRSNLLPSPTSLGLLLWTAPATSVLVHSEQETETSRRWSTFTYQRWHKIYSHDLFPPFLR